MTSQATAPGPVVVTGAGSGIGAALAGSLVAAGQPVIGVDRNTAGLPAGVEPLVCDLTDAGAVATAVTTIHERAGRGGLGGLVAAAGVPGTLPAAAVYAVNIVGLRRLTTALAPALRPGTAVVLLSSMAGYRGPATASEVTDLLACDDPALQSRLEARGLDGPEAYQLSKQLVHHLARDLAARLHPAGVRAVSISPGPVETPILDDFRETMPSLDEAGRLVGRHARPREIAAVARFVLSAEASWLNGIDIVLDGGLTALRSGAVVGSRP